MFSVNSRFDSWKNLLTGLGTARDKSTHTYLSTDGFLSHDYLEQLYLSDDIAARICDLLPNEMLRQGFKIKVNEKEFNYPNLGEILREVLVKSRIFGAAFIYIGANDGRAQEEFLDLSKTSGSRFFNVIGSNELSKASFYDDADDPKYGQVQTYLLNISRMRVHESRLIPFFGIPPLNHRYFPPSVLQRIYPVLQQFHTAWQSTAHLMSDASQGVFKLKGLHSAVASNRSEELLKRMELVDMSRSVSRSILLDAEDEDFRRDSYSFAGIPEILDKMMLRLAAAARIPVSLLMGQAPAGMNATGESDTRFFYDQVRAEQEAIKAKLEHLVRIITGDEDSKVSVEFPALWQMTDREVAELRHMEAETDRIYLQEGVLLPEEVAIRRFASDDFNIDVNERAELAQVERRREDVE